MTKSTSPCLTSPATPERMAFVAPASARRNSRSLADAVGTEKPMPDQAIPRRRIAGSDGGDGGSAGDSTSTSAPPGRPPRELAPFVAITGEGLSARCLVDRRTRSATCRRGPARSPAPHVHSSELVDYLQLSG
jgi:hypothetical protein